MFSDLAKWGEVDGRGWMETRLNFALFFLHPLPPAKCETFWRSQFQMNSVTLFACVANGNSQTTTAATVSHFFPSEFKDLLMSNFLVFFSIPTKRKQAASFHFLLSVQHSASSSLPLESPWAKQVNGLPYDCRCQDWSARHTNEIKDLEINSDAQMKNVVISEELNSKLNRQLCNYRRWMLINNLSWPPRARCII